MSRRSPPAFELPAASCRQGLTLRPATDADAAFQRRLFEAARPDTALLASWPEAVRAPFLDQQFHFQRVHYARAYPDADRLIVLKDDQPIGRLILDRAAHEWCVVDIALLPAWRGKGAGTLLLRNVLAEAARTGTTVRLSVETANPARRLYERLGFVVIEDSVPTMALEWKPSADQLKMA